MLKSIILGWDADKPEMLAELVSQGIGPAREGSETRACTTCQKQVWLGPKQLQMADTQHHIMISCLECGVTLHGIQHDDCEIRSLEETE